MLTGFSGLDNLYPQSVAVARYVIAMDVSSVAREALP